MRRLRRRSMFAWCRSIRRTIFRRLDESGPPQGLARRRAAGARHRPGWGRRQDARQVPACRPRVVPASDPASAASRRCSPNISPAALVALVRPSEYTTICWPGLASNDTGSEGKRRTGYDAERQLLRGEAPADRTVFGEQQHSRHATDPDLAIQSVLLEAHQRGADEATDRQCCTQLVIQFLGSGPSGTSRVASR